MDSHRRVPEGLAAQAEEEWGRLRNQLELASGFWLGFLFAPSPSPVYILQDRTEQLLRLRARRTVTIDPTDPSELAKVLPDLFADATNDTGCLWVRAIHVDSPDQQWMGAWEHVLLRLNERRDALRRHLGGGLVLVAHPTVKPLAREAAPDLWSVRSLVIELQPVSAASAENPRPVGGTEREWPVPPRAGTRLSPVSATSRVPELLDEVDASLSAGRDRDAVSTARRVLDLVESDNALAADLPIVLAWLSRAEEQAGDYPAAFDHARRALVTPGDMTDALGLELLSRTGDLAELLNEPGLGVDAYERIVARYRALAAEAPRPSELGLLSAGLVQLGEVYLNLGRYDEGIAALRDAVAVDRERVEARGPGGGDFATRDLSIDLERLGDALTDVGDLPGAIVAYQQSLALRPASPADPFDSDMSRDRSVALNKLGDALLRAGDVAAASARYEESVATRRQILQADPASPTGPGDLATSIERFGDARMAAGDFGAARSLYEQSITLRRDSLERFGQSPAGLRGLEASLVRLGDAHCSIADVPAATAAYEEALVLARLCLGVFGESRETVRDIAVSLAKLADVLIESGSPSAGAAMVAEALATVRHGIELYGPSLESSRDLSVCLERLGDNRLLAGELRGAVEAYDEALALRRQLLDAFGPVPAALQDLAAILDRIGDARSQMGLPEEAAAARKELADILRDLADGRSVRGVGLPDPEAAANNAKVTRG